MKPTNQTSRLSWLVPVLPAAGRPMLRARSRAAVMTPLMTSIAAFATGALITRVPCFLATKIVLSSRSTTLVMHTGLRRTPSVASVP